MHRKHLHHGTCYSIEDIPLDILIKILSYATKGDGIDLAQPHTYPTIYSYVCKKWRTTVLSTPELWSKIIINLPLNESTHGSRACTASTNSRLLSALQMCLERSRSLPLSLHIVHLQRSNKENPSLSVILETCLRHSNRWSDIIFDFPIERYIPIFLPSRHYSLLQKLTLQGSKNVIAKVWDHHDSNQSSLSREVFKDTPMLTTLHFNYFPKRLYDLAFQWTKITHFSAMISDIGEIDASLGPKIISQMPNLRSLKLTAVAEASGHTAWKIQKANENWDTKPIINAPHLEHLSFSAIKPQNVHGMMSVILVGTFFKQVSAPRITCLELEGACFYSSDAEAVSTFFKSSNCHKLPHLSLLSVPDTSVERLLEELPDIESLKLSRVEFSPKLISKLTIPNPDGGVTWKWIGPSFRRLDIEYPEMEEEDIPAFVAMVHSRILAAVKPATASAGSSTTTTTMPTPSLEYLRVLTKKKYYFSPTHEVRSSDLHTSLIDGIDLSMRGVGGVQIVFEEEEPSTTW